MFITYDPENRVDSVLLEQQNKNYKYQDSENLSRIQVYSAGRLLYTISEEHATQKLLLLSKERTREKNKNLKFGKLS